MLIFIKKLELYFKIFGKKNKYKFILFFFLILLNSLLEFISLGSLIPVIESLLNKDSMTIKILREFSINISSDNFFIYGLVFFLCTFFLRSFFFIFLNFYKSNLYANLRINLTDTISNYYLKLDTIAIQNKGSAKIIRSLISDIEIVSINITDSVFNIILNFLMIVSILFLIYFINPKALMAGIGFASTIILLYLFFYKKKINKLGEIRRENDAKKIKILQNIFATFKEIKLFNKIEFFQKNFVSTMKQYVSADKKYNIIQQSIRPVVESLAVLGMGFYIFYINKFYETENFIIELTIIAASFFRILPSINALIFNVISLKYFMPSLIVINSEVQKNNETKSNNQIEIINFKKNIELKNVFFSYSSLNHVIKNLDLKINSNDVLGIFGPSGCGKSTIIDLIIGFIKPNSGEIIINKTKINKNFILNASYISQNVALINATIKENIALGSEDRTINNSKIIESLRLSKLDTFVESLPEKENTQINDLGLNLSGGQKQRISLARAYYNKKNIIILDEPTSALDNNTANEILKNLIKNFNTIIIITHNPSVLKYCNKVFYVKENKLKVISS